MSTRARTALWSVALVAFLLLMVFRVLPAPLGGALSHVVQAATVLAAGVALAHRSRAAEGRLRRARALLAASLSVAALGGVLALAVRLAADGTPPIPSVADVVHFGFLPLCVAGLLGYPASEEVPGSRSQMLLDGVVAATALWFCTYTLLLAPAGAGAGVPVQAMVTILAYPASDVFVVAMAVGALHRVAPRARRELALAAAGVSLYAVSDVAYTVLSARGDYAPDSWVGAIAEVGLVLVVLAAVRGSCRRPPRPVVWTAFAGALPYVSVAAALVFAVALSVARGGLAHVEIVFLVTVVVALLARQLVGNRDRDGAARRLRDSRALFRSLVVASSDLITLHAADGSLTYASPEVSRVTGVAAGDLRSTPLGELVHPDDLRPLVCLLAQLRRRPGTTGQLLLRVRAADGSWRWCQTVLRDLLDGPEVRGVVGNTRDVHDRYLLEQQVHHDARHDPLTGLGNRAEAAELLELACTSGRRSRAVAALVDLDGFKQVNDTYGHLDGDRLLVAVADRLRRCLSGDDTAIRLGGDEFLVIMQGDSHAQAVAEQFLQCLHEPVLVDGRALTVGASIGLARVEDGMVPGDLLRNADLAMYAAKAAGRHRLLWYERGMLDGASVRAAASSHYVAH